MKNQCMIKSTHRLVWSYQNTNVVGFQKDIVHITIYLLWSKAVRKVDRGGVSAALLTDLSTDFECNLLGLFSTKPHAHSVDSHIQR